MLKIILLSLLLLLPGVGGASPIFISGFDGQEATTTNPDSYEFQEVTPSGGGTDAELILQQSIVHDTANGGSSSSRKALKAATTSAGHISSWKLLNDFTADPSVAVGMSVYANVLPSSGSGALGGFIESDGSVGCFVTVNNSGQLSLYYNTTATTWGTTSITNGVMRAGACSSNPNFSCTVGTVATDCPSGDTCTLKYWAGIELTQSNQSATAVICELYVDGLLQFTSTSKTASNVSSVVNFEFGAPGWDGTTAARTIYFDDLVIDDSGTRAGYGYVATKYPLTIASNAWSLETCKPNPGTSVPTCVDDYNESADTYAYYVASSIEDNLKTSGSSKAFEFYKTTPDVTLRTGEEVTAVEAVAFGRTTTQSGTRQLAVSPAVCPVGSCIVTATGVPCPGGSGCTCSVGSTSICQSDAQCCVRESESLVTTTTSSISTPTVLARAIYTNSPVAGQTDWTEHINSLGVRAKTGPSETQGTRVGAVIDYVRVQKADTLEPNTFKDHNLGAEDGVYSVGAVGDSTLDGTLQVQCIGGTNAGQNCSQESYCSWSPYHDLPGGGCGNASTGLDNSLCRSCIGHRELFPGNVGKLCTTSADAVCTGLCNTTCDSGTGTCCSNETSMTCASNSDCDFGDGDGTADAGDCDSTATCIESCPSTVGNPGECPTARAGWTGNLPSSITADVIFKCGVGGEDTGQMFVNRFPAIIQGKSTSVSQCKAIKGTGKCECSSNTDCGAGGTCTSGLCTVGSASQAACTSYAACASGKACQLAPPDYLIFLEGYNDPIPFAITNSRAGNGAHDPMCNTLAGANYGSFSTTIDKNNYIAMCPSIGVSAGPYQCAITACVNDSQCPGSSQCIGRSVTEDAQCYYGSSSTCTEFSGPCRKDADCPVGTGAQQYCDGENASVETYSPGTCRCTADNQCATGFACVGDSGKKICRKTCTVDGDCGSTSTCDTSTFSPTKVCRGRCNCACDAISCTSDDQCGTLTVQDHGGGLRTQSYRGTCNTKSGKCWNCGFAQCGLPAATAGPCSCSIDADCGAGGVCDATKKVCTSGISTRTSCRGDSQCAVGNKCLSSDPQHNQYVKGHENMAVEVYTKIDQYVKSADPVTPPVLLFSDLPRIGGTTAIGVFVPDYQCGNGYGWESLQLDMDYHRNLVQKLLTLFPSRHVIDFRNSLFEQGRRYLPYHREGIHFTSSGADLVGEQVILYLDHLNTCLKPDGTSQKYCYRPSGTWSGAICDTDSDCAGDGRCVHRRCDDSEANCPNASDTCGLD